MDTATTVAVIVAAAPGVFAVVWGIVKWSFGRNIKLEDDSKLKSEAKFEKLETEVRELKTAQALASQEARQQLTTLAGTLGELKGALTGMRDAFEEGREKQAVYYQGEMAKVEDSFRTALEKLEAKLEAKVEAKRRR